jgi:hypothetical protein
MSSIARPRGVRLSWKRFTLKPAVAGAALRKLGFVFSTDTPLEAIARTDEQGNSRRVEAKYRNGGHASLTVGGAGRGSLQQGLSVRFAATREELQQLAAKPFARARRG